MSRSRERTLQRVLEEVSRPPRRRRRAGTAPLTLGLALLLGYQLLVRLVPRAWAALLPGGLAQARQLRGWPGLLYGLAEACYGHVGVATAVIVAAVLVSWAAIRVAPPLRWVVWLVTVAVIALDAVIVFLTLQTALSATAQDAGIAL